MPIIGSSGKASTVRSSFNNAQAVRKAMLDKLKESGLGPAHAQRLRLQPRTASQVSNLNSLPVYRAGFRIPYWDIDGKPTKFFRFRYLEYGEAESGWKKLVASTAKQLRYAQPGKSLNELYLPPLAPWREIAGDTSIPIWITEGELKSACACANGLACIGLGGVWCFKSAAHALHLLPGFKWFNWKDRTVYIVYDSDAVINPQIVKAENSLARELFNSFEANPHIMRLPSLDSECKTGLDDYIVSEGVEKLEEITAASAVAYQPMKDLLSLNEDVLYVEDPGLIVRQDTLQRLSCRAFVEHAFSTRIYYEQRITKDGDLRVEEKSAPKEWLKWPHRAAVAKVTYLPGADRIANGSINCWRGWGCAPAETSSPSTVRPWLQLLDYLFTGVDSAHKIWFEQWLAYPLQHPGAKMYSAAVVWGIHQGTGKTLIGMTMMKIYGDNGTEIGDRDLYSPHNEWAEHRQFVMADEITGGDKRNTADRMKSMITQKLIRINPKYVPSYTVPDCINYYFTSNHPDAFFLEDADRRFFVHEVRAIPKPTKFYDEYAAWMHGPGPAYLFHHLLNLDMTGFNAAAHAPTTQSKKDMIEAGRSDLGQWCSRLKTDSEHMLKLGELRLKHTLFTSEELRAVYDPENKTKVTTNGMARELKRCGHLQVNQGIPVHTAKSGLQRLWAIRGDVPKMLTMKPKDVAAIYDAERTKIGDKPKEKF